MPDYPHKSHDEFFKASFGRLEIARDYLEQLLPWEVHQTLDLSQLERVNGSWVSPELAEYFSDVVYRCPLKEGKRQVWASFLLEHKSALDAFPHLQLLRYLMETWQEQRKQKQPLTPIIPIVVYHGVRKWRKRDLSSYFGKDLPQSLLPFLPRFDYVLTNVRALSDEQILELKKGLLINALLMLKHIWEPQFILKNPELIFIHLETHNQQVSEFVVSLLAYLFKNTEIARETANRFIKHLPTDLNQNAMSTYDMIQAEGIEKGAELKEREFLKNLWSLQEFSLEKIALLSGTSLERVIEVLSAHLQAEGLSEAGAAQTLEAYQAKFV
ncbi:MAG TPA: Rpn family recombination-promoting nuclease/putative transposase [Haliscomenobacter sp.]|uniref:Rpn family recombination-promoting nuclease/putative transposase n=1 Tax=Haliscomenobacter sp. TaxID=2717303 RepID=UPI002CD5E921|nr:Rpn family recombination-promoting nuclease/putative transposase [Haliscomenobacter sp.]HOY18379.1 Rpn family recombination-promoting nuclease/putative transposase [Haliscomenobacter sp.]